MEQLKKHIEVQIQLSKEVYNLPDCYSFSEINAALGRIEAYEDILEFIRLNNE